MNLSQDNLTAAKLAGTSIIGSMTGVALEDTTQIGQIVSILIGIISGVASLVKMFKKKK